jgi:hypothetical protein
MQYAYQDKMAIMVDRRIDTYDPEIVAPAHGFVVMENGTEYLELMKPAMRRISEESMVEYFFA